MKIILLANYALTRGRKIKETFYVVDVFFECLTSTLLFVGAFFVQL
jgi:hypothetical protein